MVRAAERDTFLDVTDELAKAIAEAGVTDGCAVAYCRHTTCGLLINEWEEGALLDLRVRMDALVPRSEHYAHDDFDRRTQNLHADERRNGRSHVAQMLLGGTSHAIPVVAGEAALGRWQRLIFVELDEPKERSLLFHVFGV